MYARVVRFTDIDIERINRVAAEIEEGGGEGPGPETKAKRVAVMTDESQGTAVVALYFETEQDMRDSEAALDEMDPSDTPGTRASVDLCEVKVEADA
jgi:hypothetical protein